MKRAKSKTKRDDVLPEYDFKGGVRGKHARAYSKDANVVTLAPDVAKAFPDSESVNAALRLLIRVASKAKS